MSNEAQHLLNHIQYKTGKTLDEIAQEIGYSRPYLNNVKLKGAGGGKVVGVLKSKYVNELRDFSHEKSNLAASQNNGEISLLETLMAKLITVTDTTNRLLERQEKGLLEKVDRIDANLSIVVAQSEKIDYELESGRMVVLQALSRLENKPVNQLMIEADSLKFEMAKAKDELYKNSVKDNQSTGRRK